MTDIVVIGCHDCSPSPGPIVLIQGNHDGQKESSIDHI